MAEFGNGRKNRVPVKKSDIKQAIKKANDRLKKANEKLDQDISLKKKSIISVDKEISAHEKNLKSILLEIDNAKHDAVEARTESKKERAKLPKLKKQLSEALINKDLAQSELNNLAKESKVLDKKIVKMNEDLAITSTIKGEIKLLKSDKKKESEELGKIKSEANDVKKELSKLRTESIKKKETHKELFAKLGAEIEIKQKSLDTVDSEYESKMAELNTNISSLRDVLRDKEQEADVMQSLVKKRELDYIDVETKYKQAENTLMFTREITNKEIEREKREVEQVKEQFKRWKTTVLEEVARLKLKNKIENIDKAGLSEILNG